MKSHHLYIWILWKKNPSSAVKQQQNLGNITSHLANENGRPRVIEDDIGNSTSAHFNVHDNCLTNPSGTSCIYCYEMDNETMSASKKQQTKFRNMFCDSSYTHDGSYAPKLATDSDHLANSNGHATITEENIANSVFAPFNCGDNCGNEPSDLSCSAITTFVPTRLQELHFNRPKQCQLNKRNGKFTEDGTQKAFANVKTMANKHISDYNTSTITSNVYEQKKSH